MKHQRSVGNGGVDFLQPIEVEFDGSFVEPMSSTDRNGQSIDVSFSHKPCGIVCFSQELCRGGVGISVLSDVAQLAFNRHAGVMCQLNHTTREQTIIGERQFGGVDHYGGIPVVDASRC